MKADVSVPECVVERFDEACHAFGGVDAIVNNAGIMKLAPIAQTEDEAVKGEYEAVWPDRFADRIQDALAGTVPDDADPAAVGRAVVDMVAAEGDCACGAKIVAALVGGTANSARVAASTSGPTSAAP